MVGEVSAHCRQLVSVQDNIKKNYCYFKCSLFVGDLPFYHSISKYLMTEGLSLWGPWILGFWEFDQVEGESVRPWY